MTEKQYSFAWAIANTLNIQLPSSFSKEIYAQFINEHIQEYQNQIEIQRVQLAKSIANYDNLYEEAAMEERFSNQELYEKGILEI